MDALSIARCAASRLFTRVNASRVMVHTVFARLAAVASSPDCIRPGSLKPMRGWSTGPCRSNCSSTWVLKSFMSTDLFRSLCYLASSTRSSCDPLFQVMGGKQLCADERLEGIKTVRHAVVEHLVKPRSPKRTAVPGDGLGVVFSADFSADVESVDVMGLAANAPGEFGALKVAVTIDRADHNDCATIALKPRNHVVHRRVGSQVFYLVAQVIEQKLHEHQIPAMGV